MSERDELPSQRHMSANDMIRTYLIWSREHNSWWRPNRRGYTTNIKSAGHYSFTEALEICFGANYFVNDHQPPNETIVPIVVGGDEFSPNRR